MCKLSLVLTTTGFHLQSGEIGMEFRLHFMTCHIVRLGGVMVTGRAGDRKVPGSTLSRGTAR